MCIRCRVCGSAATVCYWSDIVKAKDGKRKTFSLTEPIPLNKSTGSFDVKRIRKNFPESEFIFFSSAPSAFKKNELAGFDAKGVGAHCANCNSKL